MNSCTKWLVLEYEGGTKIYIRPSDVDYIRNTQGYIGCTIATKHGYGLQLKETVSQVVNEINWATNSSDNRFFSNELHVEGEHEL